MFKIYIVLFVFAGLCFGCTPKKAPDMGANKKIGVLLVSHGSRSESWRKMLLSVQDSVQARILYNQNIKGIKTAFMEYNGPSIADQIKEFEKDGFTDVVVVPLLLTVSPHSFDDIPHILGIKNTQSEIDKLKGEKIEVYNTKLKIKITPLLDFPKILGENIINRVKKLSLDPANEACVLIAYGDVEYEKEWSSLMNVLADEIKAKLGIMNTKFAWCGHIVNYKTQPIIQAIKGVLNNKNKALIIPVLVAVDEMFQVKIIGGAIDESGQSDKISYIPDAILPDAGVNQWIVDITNQYANDILKSKE